MLPRYELQIERGPFSALAALNEGKSIKRDGGEGESWRGFVSQKQRSRAPPIDKGLASPLISPADSNKLCQSQID
jgi:hypothetical protein